ncbi:MAG: flavodoxin family protein [Raoultibacter sp.]
MHSEKLGVDEVIAALEAGFSGGLMKYIIAYSSATGNTEFLAREIQAALPAEDCVKCAAVRNVTDHDIAAADRVFVGFWTDKGTGQESVADFLHRLAGKEVFLFGTAGFGQEQSYFDQILDRVQQAMAPSAKLIGRFMCQGKMPATVRSRYVSMAKDPAMADRMQMMIANFDQAASHPNATDCANLRAALQG